MKIVSIYFFIICFSSVTYCLDAKVTWGKFDKQTIEFQKIIVQKKQIFVIRSMQESSNNVFVRAIPQEKYIQLKTHLINTSKMIKKNQRAVSSACALSFKIQIGTLIENNCADNLKRSDLYKLGNWLKEVSLFSRKQSHSL